MTVKHVLVVDDSRSARFMLRKMLGKINLTADLAKSGEEAIDYLKNNHPDAIFMDHMMPGMNGLETVQQIKENPQTSVIPVIMYTSQDGEEYEKNIISHGVMDILSKPASPDNLSAVVRKLNKLPEIPIGQIEVEQEASNDSYQLSTDDIDKIVRQTAEAAVAAAVRYQVIGAMAQQLSKFRSEVNLCDDNMATRIAENIFDTRITSYSDNISQQINQYMDEMTRQLEKVEIDKVNKLNPKILEEIKSVVSLSSTNKAIEASRETANSVANDAIMTMTEAVNRANTKIARRMTLMSFVAAGVGIFSALVIYSILA
jgi:CheY-like chemotaxis protein